MRSFAAAVFVAASLLPACSRKHVAVDSVPEYPYPACDADAGSLAEVAHGHLRAGPGMNEQDVVERFSIAHDACRLVFTGRAEWRLMASDMEVVYAADGVPLRAWKRMTIPGSTRPDGNADTRMIELRGEQVTITRRDPEGKLTHEILRPGGRDTPAPGARTAAVIGNGRGILTMWIQHAKLKPGEKVRQLVLDFRDMVERLENVTLKREADQDVPALGRRVRVYTIYGREAVYTDDDDVVLGDLAGLMPAEKVPTPEPRPAPSFGGADPRKAL